MSLFQISKLRKGQKYCEIKFDGAQPIWQLTKEPLLSRFQAGLCQKDSTVETRQNLDLHLTGELCEILEEFDDYVGQKLKS